MKYEDALNLLGDQISIDCSDRRFMVTIVDPEFREDDLTVRIEISFLDSLQTLKPGAVGGKFLSIKSGRLSAAVLVDWELVDEQNGRAFIDFCRTWDSDKYYSKNSPHQRVYITEGYLSANIIEFTGPTGVQCAGLVNLEIEDGRLSIGGGASQKAKALISKLLSSSANPGAGSGASSGANSGKEEVPYYYLF